MNRTYRLLDTLIHKALIPITPARLSGLSSQTFCETFVRFVQNPFVVVEAGIEPTRDYPIGF